MKPLVLSASNAVVSWQSVTGKTYFISKQHRSCSATAFYRAKQHPRPARNHNLQGYQCGRCWAFFLPGRGSAMTSRVPPENRAHPPPSRNRAPPTCSTIARSSTRCRFLLNQPRRNGPAGRAPLTTLPHPRAGSCPHLPPENTDGTRRPAEAVNHRPSPLVLSAPPRQSTIPSFPLPTSIHSLPSAKPVILMTVINAKTPGGKDARGGKMGRKTLVEEPQRARMSSRPRILAPLHLCALALVPTALARVIASKKVAVGQQRFTTNQQSGLTLKAPRSRGPITLIICATACPSTTSIQHCFHFGPPLYMKRRIFSAAQFEVAGPPTHCSESPLAVAPLAHS